LVEQKLQAVIQFLVRTIGPVLLRGGLGGGAGAATPSRASDDDFDDFDDDDDDSSNKIDTDSAKKETVNISLPTFRPDSAPASSASTSSEATRVNLLESFDDEKTSSTTAASSQTTEDDDFSLR
jgi:hypothetical protein